MRSPVVVFAICWVLGVCLALNFKVSDMLFILLGLCVLMVAACLVMKFPWKSPILYFCVLIISAVYCHWTHDKNSSRISENLLAGSEVEVTGDILSPMEIDGDRVSFVVKWSEFSEKIQISVKVLTLDDLHLAKEWKRNDRISLKGTLIEPSPARNFGGFDYKRYLKFHHIHWLVRVKGLSQVEVHQEFRWNLNQVYRWNDHLRDFLGSKLDSIYEADQSGFMKSLILGITGDIDPQQFQQFSQIGLTHVLAISGLHVAVFLAACMGILRACKVARETNILIAMILIPAYVLITGSSPSVVRSGAMGMIALYAARKGLLKDGVHIVSIVGFLMLLWNPYLVMDVSFQLSFLVTMGLIIGVPHVSRLLPISTQWVNSSIAVTLVAQAVSFPLSIYYFNQFSLLSWLANLFLVPLISFIVLPLGSAAMLISLLHEKTAAGLAWITELINSLVFCIVNELNSYPIFIMIWASPSLVWIVLYYAGLICIIGSLLMIVRPHGPVGMVESRRPSSKMMNLCYLCLGSWLILLWVGYHPNAWNRQGEVQFLDVGQGDAILVRTPDNHYILNDGGGTLSFRKAGDEWKIRRDPYEVGKDLLVPLLKKRGVQVIDYLIISHEHADHIGGLQAVLEQIPVRHIIFNGTLSPNQQTTQLFRAALTLNIPLIKVYEGKNMQVGQHTTLGFLYPLESNNPTISLDSSQNNASVAFIMKLYNSYFLFTGDMEQMGEKEMLQKFATSHRGSGVSGRSSDSGNRSSSNSGGFSAHPIDVLKVAHHGSKTSTTEKWLQYWQPKAAVISVGIYNTYGHPSPPVLKRLSEHNIKVFRTDGNGEVQMNVKEHSLQVRTKLNNPMR